MKVELRLEAESEFRFGTSRGPIGPYRFLQITINGKPFSTWYKLDDVRSSWDENYMRNVDDQLGRQFERMAEKVIKAAFALVPEGIDIAELSDDRLQWIMGSVRQLDPSASDAKAHETINPVESIT